MCSECGRWGHPRAPIFWSSAVDDIPLHLCVPQLVPWLYAWDWLGAAQDISVPSDNSPSALPAAWA